MKTNSLRSFERIKNLKTIEKVFSKDAFFVYGQTLSARYIIDHELDFPLKVGFSVSKRLYKKAHDRNKLKRWMREAFRNRKTDLFFLSKQQSTKIALFLIITKKLDLWHFSAVEKMVQDIIQTTNKKITSQLNALDKKTLSTDD